MRYLGIDFGLRRIGLATSFGELASPYKVIEVKNLEDAISQVKEIVEQEGFDKVVVGLPGGKTGKVVAGFIKGLRNKGLDVVSADETLSTQKAISQMIQLGLPKKKRRANDDLAAVIILQNYLDNK